MSIRRFSRVAAIVVAAVGCLVLAGWAFDIGVLKSLSPGLLTMKPNTALAFGFAGISLWIHSFGEERASRTSIVSRACAAVVVALGAFTLSEHLCAWDLRFDCLMFQDAPSAADPSPAGRMCPATALNLVFLGTALLLLDVKRRAALSQLLALAATLNASVALLGYVFEAPSLYALAPYSSVALHTAGTTLVLSLGVLGARPDQGLMVHLTSDTMGSQGARRLLPAVIFVPVLLGRLALSGERWGHFGMAITTAISAELSIMVLAGVIWWNAGHSHRVEEAQRRSEERLAERTEELEALLTERVQLLESERAARTEAERASRLKDEFVATVSHELRTPLNAIQGWAHLLQRPAVGPAQLAKGLVVIERNTRQLTSIVSDLLDTSRIVSGKLHVELTPVDVASVIDAALEDLRAEATAKGVALEVALARIDGDVQADTSRLRQVVQNLVSNAVKFTPRGGRVNVTLSSDAERLILRVRDTGQGIDPAFLPVIFDRFRQADASTVRQHGGLGLGLAIVKHVVDLHGGTISASSGGLGQGAEFTLTLPLRSAPSRACPSSIERAPRIAADDLRGVSVLLVDDEPDAREIAQRILEEQGASVVVAASGREALEILAGRELDVLVCDISMPGMDGYEIARRLGARGDAGRGAVPAVALTAFARPEDKARALAAGFQAHVTKPIEPAVLVATVARLHAM